VVGVGELDSNFIHTPGIFIKRVVETGKPELNQANV